MKIRNSSNPVHEMSWQICLFFIIICYLSEYKMDIDFKIYINKQYWLLHGLPGFEEYLIIYDVTISLLEFWRFWHIFLCTGHHFQ